MPWNATPLNTEPFTYSPAVVSWGLSRLDVFGISSRDGGVRHAWFDGQNWSAWESLGGTSTSSPAACSWGPGHLDIFVRGENGSLFWRYYDRVVAGGWSVWIDKPEFTGVLTSAPAAASWARRALGCLRSGYRRKHVATSRGAPDWRV
jgi:hypothetical protein